MGILVHTSTLGLMQERYQSGRKMVHRLALLLERVERMLRHLRRRAAAGHDPSARERVAAFDLGHRAMRDQARAFVQDWFSRQADQPIVDAVQVDEAGNVIAEQAVPLLATFSEEDEGLLVHNLQLLDDLLDELDALRGDLHDLPQVPRTLEEPEAPDGPDAPEDGDEREQPHS